MPGRTDTNVFRYKLSLLYFEKDELSDEFCEWLFRELCTKNCSVFYPRIHIVPGQPVPSALGEGIMDSEYVLVVVTDVALLDKEFNMFKDAALMYFVRNRMNAFIPITVGSKPKQIPFGLLSLKFVHFGAREGWGTDAANCGLLCKTIFKLPGDLDEDHWLKLSALDWLHDALEEKQLDKSQLASKLSIEKWLARANCSYAPHHRLCAALWWWANFLCGENGGKKKKLLMAIEEIGGEEMKLEFLQKIGPDAMETATSLTNSEDCFDEEECCVYRSNSSTSMSTMASLSSLSSPGNESEPVPACGPRGPVMQDSRNAGLYFQEMGDSQSLDVDEQGYDTIDCTNPDGAENNQNKKSQKDRNVHDLEELEGEIPSNDMPEDTEQGLNDQYSNDTSVKMFTEDFSIDMLKDNWKEQSEPHHVPICASALVEPRSSKMGDISATSGQTSLPSEEHSTGDNRGGTSTLGAPPPNPSLQTYQAGRDPLSLPTGKQGSEEKMSLEWLGRSLGHMVQQTVPAVVEEMLAVSLGRASQFPPK